MHTCTNQLTILSYQVVQNLPPIQASLRFLPNIAVSVVLSVTTGLFVQHMRIEFVVTITSILYGVSTLLMALVNPTWPFWYCGLWSVVLNPMSVDGMYSLNPR
jgi:ABC-type glucose/galactose transport system permease subunit